MPSDDNMSSSTSTMINRAVMGPDNRCCFCLTLRSGSVIVAMVNFVVNIIGFCWYTKATSSDDSSFSQETTVSYRDLGVFILFTNHVLADILLVYGAVKKKPNHVITWLCANSPTMVVLLISVAFLLFFGYVRLSLEHDEYVTLLCLVGCLAAGHFFSCIVVYHLVRFLKEEARLLSSTSVPHGVAAASAPPASTGQEAFGDTGNTMHPPPSPPPTYEEVAKARPMLLPTSQLSSSKKSLEVVASSPSAKEYESPPEYQEAVERGSPGASCKGLAKRFGSSEADGEDERLTAPDEAGKDGQGSVYLNMENGAQE